MASASVGAHRSLARDLWRRWRDGRWVVVSMMVIGVMLPISKIQATEVLVQRPAAHSEQTATGLTLQPTLSTEEVVITVAGQSTRYLLLLPSSRLDFPTGDGDVWIQVRRSLHSPPTTVGQDHIEVLGDGAPVMEIRLLTVSESQAASGPWGSVATAYVRVPKGAHVLSLVSPPDTPPCLVQARFVSQMPDEAVAFSPSASRPDPQPSALGGSPESGQWDPLAASLEFLGIHPELPPMGPHLGISFPLVGSRPSATVALELRPSLAHRTLSLRTTVGWYRVIVDEEEKVQLPIGGTGTLHLAWITDVFPVETGLLVRLPLTMKNLDPWAMGGLGAYYVHRDDSQDGRGASIGTCLAIGADVPTRRGTLVGSLLWNGARKRFGNLNEDGMVAQESLSTIRFGFSWLRSF